MDVSLVVFSVCVAAYTIVAAFFDWREHRLPNVVTVSAFAAAILFHAIYGAMSGGLLGVGSQLLFAALGFATGFGILFVMWMMGSSGGGDVKYMGALGAWLGATFTFQVFIVGAIFVLIGSIGALVWQGLSRGMGVTKERYLTPAHGDGKKVSDEEAIKRKVRRRLLPFGVPIAFATWCVLAFAILGGWQLPQSRARAGVEPANQADTESELNKPAAAMVRMSPNVDA